MIDRKCRSFYLKLRGKLPVTVVIEFVVTRVRQMYTKTSPYRIEYLNSCVHPNAGVQKSFELRNYVKMNSIQGPREHETPYQKYQQ